MDAPKVVDLSTSKNIQVQGATDKKNDDLEAEGEPEEVAPAPAMFTSRWFGFEVPLEATNNAEKLPPHKIFLIFLSFGFRAFGGPVAQIAMMKDEMVTHRKWITLERFQRVYAVYQILPGPEATELACYFGMLSGGRLGAILGGLGFVLPGFLMMLFWSWIYVDYGNNNSRVLASFRCLQVTVSAFIFRACFKLADGALYDAKKNIFSWEKGFLCLFCFLVSISCIYAKIHSIR